MHTYMPNVVPTVRKLNQGRIAILFQNQFLKLDAAVQHYID